MTTLRRVCYQKDQQGPGVLALIAGHAGRGKVRRLVPATSRNGGDVVNRIRGFAAVRARIVQKHSGVFVRLLAPAKAAKALLFSEIRPNVFAVLLAPARLSLRGLRSIGLLPFARPASVLDRIIVIARRFSLAVTDLALKATAVPPKIPRNEAVTVHTTAPGKEGDALLRPTCSGSLSLTLAMAGQTFPLSGRQSLSSAQVVRGQRVTVRTGSDGFGRHALNITDWALHGIATEVEK